MRVKEHLQMKQEEAFEEDLLFQEELKYYMSQPTNEELEDMQKEAKAKNLFHKLHPSNNPDHYPLQGA